MFATQILDVAIGLIFVYLIFSLAVTAAGEMVAACLRSRARVLKRGIHNMLRDEFKARDLYAHPLIRSISRGNKKPSYIPSRMFATALIDTIAPAEKDGTRRMPSINEARSHIEKIVALHWQDAGANPEQFKKNIETWFNSSMERVSGWYKRHTQVVAFVLATIVTVAANADTMVVANALWTHPSLRQSVIANAERYVAANAPPSLDASESTDGADPPPVPPDQQADLEFDSGSEQFRAAMADLQELQLPIGWRTPTNVTGGGELRLTTHDAKNDWPGLIWGNWFQALRVHLFGWFMTILAISLGAPFWFDTLNKFMAIRSAGKAPEERQKSPKAVPRPREPKVTP
jgi:hypothetical protein